MNISSIRLAQGLPVIRGLQAQSRFVPATGIDQVQFSGSGKKVPQYQMFINGEFLPGTSGQTFKVVNPLNQRVIARVAESTPADVDIAVKAARTAFKTWGKTTPEQRAQVLRNIAAEIRANAEELANLEVLNMGKPLAEAQMDVNDSASWFDTYAEKALEIKDKPLPPVEPGTTGHLETLPRGVAAQIIPWNYPLMMAAWKLAPALAAGCTSVIKSAEDTPLSLLALAKSFEKAGLPKGVVNIVTGGPEVGKALSTHPDVDVISFTGSTSVGKAIKKANADNFKPLILELGGKSPTIVFDDADIENAVNIALFGIMVNQGEVCSAGSRIIVQDGIYDKFVARMTERAKDIKLGDGFAPDTKMGPMVSKRQQRTVLDYIKLGKKEGAKLLVGGGKPGDPSLAKGNFVSPTLFADVNPDSRIAQEEIFGPVGVIMRFKTEEEALKLANGTQYGLAAGIITKDEARAERIKNGVEAGIVWINASQPAPASIVWNGWKNSGQGHDDIEHYSKTRSVIDFKTVPFYEWYPKSEQK